jgi:hypothetical protein
MDRMDVFVFSQDDRMNRIDRIAGVVFDKMTRLTRWTGWMCLFSARMTG